MFDTDLQIKVMLTNNSLIFDTDLRIKVMLTNILAAFMSTVMLTIGDAYGIPYLYFPWLVNTIEGIAFYEGPTLFGLAYAVLPNANIPAGFFIFITLLIYGTLIHMRNNLQLNIF